MAIVRVGSSDKLSNDVDGAFSVDIFDLVLFGIGDSIGKIRSLLGDDKPLVDFGNGVCVTISEQDPLQSWRDRMGCLQDLVQLVVREGVDLDSGEVCRMVLEADGWSWTGYTLRTPLWMHDFDEVSRVKVAGEFEVLQWLGKSSLETR